MKGQKNEKKTEKIEVEKLMIWLTDATINEDLVAIMERPAEALPWYRYRKRFINKKLVNSGKKYQARHLEVLDRAQTQFGVPTEIVVAIIGVPIKTIRFFFIIFHPY